MSSILNGVNFDEDLKNRSKTFNFSINIFSILNLLAIATLWYRKSTFLPKLNLNKLQVIQNKAVRAICSFNWREHVIPYFFRCNILKIKDVAKLETAKFMYKFTNQTLSKYFLAYFRRVSATHNRRTKVLY